MDANPFITALMPVATDFVDKCKDYHQTHDQVVTGKTIATYKIEPITDGIRITLPHYFLALERGRKAGKVPADFISIIEQWAKDKNLTFKDNKELHKFARGVSWWTHKEGSKKNREHTNDNFFDAAIQKLYDDAMQSVAAQTMNKLQVELNLGGYNPLLTT
jgi:hypothetical protein